MYFCLKHFNERFQAALEPIDVEYGFDFCHDCNDCTRCVIKLDAYVFYDLLKKKEERKKLLKDTDIIF